MAWTRAHNLKPGDHLQTPTGDTATTTTYNLTIDATHDYYVVAGTTAVLVHNCDAYDPQRPAGTRGGWKARTANNGKGTVWQAPGSTGNSITVRITNPTDRYPNGYVRFYYEYGQPIGLDGKPGPNSVTHIPIGPDGAYPNSFGVAVVKLDLEGASILRVCFDGRLSLLTDSGHELLIETLSTLQILGDEALTFEPEAPGASLPNLVNLVKKDISHAEVTDAGVLKICFRGYAELATEPHEVYEAWSIVGPRDKRIICMPGGELAIWHKSGD